MTPRVLLVEDNPGHAHLLREMLMRTAPSQFELAHVRRLGEALRRLNEAPYDLVLLDLSLPDSWGLETFAQARAQVPDVPIIVLSSLDDESLAARAAQEGAQDYLVKGQVDGHLLVRAMRYAIERGRTEALVRAQRDLGLALGAATEMDQILCLCVEVAIRVSGMDCGGIYLVDKASGDVDLAFQQGLSPRFVADASHYDANSSHARLVMAGQPLYVQHQELDLLLSTPERREGLRALAVIPVHHEGQVIACLNIASHTLDQVPVFARNALETIAAQVGSVIARVQAEQALQRSAEQLRFQAQLLDSVREAVVAVDAVEGRVIYWGKGAEALYGYSAAEIMGKPAPFTDALQDEEEKERLRQVFETGSWRGQYRQKRKDGDWFWVDSVVSLVTDQEGQPFGLIGINRDVTERVQAEKEIKKSTPIQD
jgi:PAS domain S-box-containing protein